MERLQALSWMAFSLFLGALLLGIRSLETPLLEVQASFFLLATFMFFLRFKIALDDHLYFGITMMKRWQSQVGLIFAVVSWFLFIISAYSLHVPADAYVLLLMSIGVSTLWIIVTGIRDGFYREQIHWLATNALYMCGIGVLLWSSRPHPHDETALYKVAQWGRFQEAILLILIVIVVFDFSKSRSIDSARN